MATAAVDQIRCLAEADLLLLLAGWLQTPPTDADHGEADLRRLAGCCGLSAADADCLVRVAGHRRSPTVDAWRCEHDRLFEGGVSCPPNETAYIRRDKGAILADLNGFYHAFGFDPAAEVGEKPDHIVTELQFAALLLVMAARAAAGGRDEDEATTRRALFLFAADHLGAWIDIFGQRLGAVARQPAFAELGGLIEAGWRLVCAHHDLPVPGNEAADVDPDPGTPYECDGCGAGR